jgi:3-oxoacyl-[acyl-carrier-protein] synthase II
MLRKLLSTSSSYALAAAGEAFMDSGVQQSELTGCGIYVGSVSLEANPEAFIPALRQSIDECAEVNLSRFARQGMKLIDPLFLVRSLPNAGLCGVGIQYQVLGPNANITNGQVSGLEAIFAAVEAIRRGEADIALAGGYDTLLQMDCIVEHLLAGRLAQRNGNPQHACRPFDRNRDGYPLSEGAAFVMLEAASHARHRSARVYGEIVSSAECTSPGNLLRPQADDGAVAFACASTLEEGEISAEDVDAVFLDGFATPADDDREAAAYQSLLGNHRPLVTGFCGSFGFVGAATGAFSVVHSLLAMEQGVVPPMINCDEPLPQYQLNVAHEPCVRKVRNALIWTSDRGVKNAAVLLRSPGV